MHRRTAPPNKYLRWELHTHPLGDEQWSAARLLTRIHRVLAANDPDVGNDRGVNYWAKAGFVAERVVYDDAGRPPYLIMAWPTDQGVS